MIIVSYFNRAFLFPSTGYADVPTMLSAKCFGMYSSHPLLLAVLAEDNESCSPKHMDMEKLT